MPLIPVAEFLNFTCKDQRYMTMLNPYDPYNIQPEMPDMSELTPEQQEEVRVKVALYGCVSSFLIIIIGLALLALFAGCRTKYVPVVELRDSIRTEVVTSTVYVPDTQYVTLPAQIVERTTPDTTSTLRTSFAESTATIRGGLLHHVLRNLEVPVPVPVQHKETTRDSIVYREKEVPVPVPVVQEVARPLSAWQQVRIWLGNVILAALGIAAGVWIIKKRTWWIRLLRIFTK